MLCVNMELELRMMESREDITAATMAASAERGGEAQRLSLHCVNREKGIAMNKSENLLLMCVLLTQLIYLQLYLQLQLDIYIYPKEEESLRSLT